MRRKEVIKKKIFLDEIPKKKYGNGFILDWENSIGYIVKGFYGKLDFEIKIVNYNLKTKRITINYKGNNFEKGIREFIDCRLGKILGIITDDFKIEMGQTFKDNKRDITIIDRKREQDKNGKWWKYYKYNCNICSFDCGKHYSIKDKIYKEELWMEENCILRGNGCSCCCTSSKVVVENINSIYKINPWMIPIIGEKIAKTHTCGSGDNTYPTCPDCGQVKRTAIKISQICRTHSIGCEICGDGVKYPNKFMFNLLEQLEIDFKTEYAPNWIKPRRYDFYIPSMNSIIEMDGGLGHGHKVHPKDNKTIEETLEIDDYKDEQAKLHGIEVIRIDCYYDGNNRFEYIKDNIKNKLNNILELKYINWIKCDEFALTNLVKIACNYKRDNPNLTTTEIGKLMGGYCRAGVSNWLYKGNELGWCNYDSHEEMVKSALNTGKLNGKQVEVFKDGISLGIFESATEISRQSEKLFGVKLLQSCISDVCLGKAKYHKGFTFKYV